MLNGKFQGVEYAAQAQDNFPLQPTTQENFKVTSEYLHTMATTNKPTVTLNMILLVDVDMEKAYNLGLEISKTANNTIFQGINVFSFPNNRDVHHFSFLTDADMINNIIKKVKSSLNLNDQNIRYQITPTIRPSYKPPEIMST